MESHRKFAEKLSLTFPLLSDPDHTLIEKSGFWTKKTRDGKEFLGVERSTLLVDPEGIVRRVFRNVTVEGHAEKVLEALRELQKQS